MEIILTPPSNPVAFEIFNMYIRWYGIILSISIFLGIFLINKLLYLRYTHIESDFFIDCAPFFVLFSVIGARLFYIYGEKEFYFNNPLEILMINHGGLSIWGAIIFGIASVAFYSFKKNVNSFKILDTIAVVMPLCQALGRWGNFFNQEAYGKPSSFFIKMYISKSNRIEGYSSFDYFHPTFLYESILDLIIFFVLLKLFLKSKEYKISTFFWLYLILYSLVRIIVESCRIDSILNIATIPVAQLISLIVLFISITVLFFMYKKRGFD